jgi:hypothetical protein
LGKARCDRKNTSFKSNHSVFKWVMYLTSLNLGFLICKA